MTDHLTLRIKPGDEQASELFYNKYYTLLYGFSNKFFREYEEPLEVVQEVFTKLREERGSIDPVVWFKSYLLNITKNITIYRLDGGVLNGNILSLFNH